MVDRAEFRLGPASTKGMVGGQNAAPERLPRTSNSAPKSRKLSRQLGSSKHLGAESDAAASWMRAKHSSRALAHRQQRPGNNRLTRSTVLIGFRRPFFLE